MNISRSTIEEVAAVLAEVQAKEREFKAQREALERTLDFLTQARNNPAESTAPQRLPTTNGWAAKLHGKTQKRALVMIAQEGGGKVTVHDPWRVAEGCGTDS